MRYYYSQTRNKYYRSIIAARNHALLDMQNNYHHPLYDKLRAENFSQLESNEWCREHWVTVSAWLDLIPTHTKWKWELAIHKWVYQFIHQSVSP